ncbi:hypothetical protein [Mucilaginibacter flavidus]|uniref:hypothetical protein n=1 Tax=Mucilaginibacter flavidus TaxID=2949309 RepID=UPI0020931495|nr:hypothetical protein [Mucilaginibacter flavidus]MCO5948894.1 hypothetical protein [Mucilaginibacter flavidus]
MQDKEFDTLFRSKLENFEAAPTSQVWDGIVEGLHGKRRYAVLLPWLSIAASVLVLVASGVLFIPQKTAVKPSASHEIAKTQVTPQVIKPSPAIPQQQSIAQIPAVATAPVNRMAQVRPVKTNVQAPVTNTAPETVPANVNAAQPHEQQIIAAVQPKEVISPEAPGSQTQVVAPQTVDMPVAAAIKPVIAAAMPNIVDKQSIASARPKHKAHGIGGFLNTVIAAVDKRKDKIIEFTDSDDDDESNITAVNLGILKFKKDKAEVSSLAK